MDFWGVGKKRRTLSEKFQQIWNQSPITSLQTTFEGSTLKTKIWPFWILGAHGAKTRGSKPKKFQQIWNHDPKIYVIQKFESPSSKNEKFQNFSHFWKFFEKFWGPKSKFWFHRHFCFGLKNTFWKFESSSSKNEKFQNFEYFWQFLKIFWKILRP